MEFIYMYSDLGDFYDFTTETKISKRLLSWSSLDTLKRSFNVPMATGAVTIESFPFLF